MDPFTVHRGIVAPLNRSHIDTDQIIPKQFLKSIRRTGYGPSAFFDWRYDAEGHPDPLFVLNQNRYEGRSVLVTGTNFGCGSSREHAVWALLQDGIRAIIAPSGEVNGEPVPAFADIFRSNAVKNGLLLIELSQLQVNRLLVLIGQEAGLELTIDLEHQEVRVHTGDEEIFVFDIDPGIKERLLEGLDDIAISLQSEAEIDRFEKTHNCFLNRPSP